MREARAESPLSTCRRRRAADRSAARDRWREAHRTDGPTRTALERDRAPSPSFAVRSSGSSTTRTGASPSSAPGVSAGINSRMPIPRGDGHNSPGGEQEHHDRDARPPRARTVRRHGARPERQSRRRRHRRRLHRRGGVDAIDAREKRERHVVGAAALHGGVQHLPGRFDLSPLERRDAVVKQLLRLALLLGHRAAGAIDVGACPRVIAIEKQRARPDVDGLRVIAPQNIDRVPQSAGFRFWRRVRRRRRWTPGSGWLDSCGADRTCSRANYAAESAVIQERNAAD